jgi:hypothetical protein
MPDDPVGRFGLAGAYLDAGPPEETVLEYQETTRLKRDCSAAHRGLGGLWRRRAAGPRRRRPTRTGLDVMARTGDRQTKQEIEAFLGANPSVRHGLSREATRRAPSEWNTPGGCIPREFGPIRQ